MAAMTLKPLVRWLACCHIAPALSAAIVLGLLLTGIGIGFFHLGRPALVWMNERYLLETYTSDRPVPVEVAGATLAQIWRRLLFTQQPA